MDNKDNPNITEDFKMLSTCDPEDSKNTKIYRLPVLEKSIADGVFISETLKQFKMKDEKIILVMGATGVGKTTLINRMINYMFDVSYSDPFRFQLIEETGRLQTRIQTTDIHVYCIDHEKLPYKLKVIDSPGINPTTTRHEDKQTIEKFRFLCESKKVETVNAICIVEKYRTNRLTEVQVYTFQTIAQIFGKDVHRNVFIMATCCDDVYDNTTETEPPQLLQFFNELSFRFTDYYLFNNKDVYKKPFTDKSSIKYVVEAAFWHRSTQSFKQFFQTLEVTAPISLSLTTEILQKKYNITNAQLPYLVRVLKTNIHEIETLEQDRRIIEEMINNPDKSNFEVQVSVTKKEMIDITEPNHYSTWCNTCKVECHYPCDISPSNILYNSLWWCSSMSWFFNREGAVKCTVCIGKCPWRDHIQRKQRKVDVTRPEKRTNESLKQLYMQDKEAKLEAVKKTIESKIVLACNRLLEDFKEIKQCIDYVNTHSLSSKPTTIQEYVDDVIDTEKQHKTDGYEQRIHCLKRLAEMNNIDIPEHVEKAKSFIQDMLKKESWKI